MTTPRIEETINKIVEAGKQRADWFEPSAEVILATTAKSQMLKAHQAGRDQAVKKLKPFVERVRLDVDVIVCDCGEEYKDSDLDLSVRELEQALDNTIKTLQDNK